MGLLRSKIAGICPVDENCSEWVVKYMGYCLCNTRDGISFALGWISVIGWGVAEIPQIITNYKKHSAEGLSVLFLSAWIVGDSLNLFGCMLEPATLPTQYYTAVLYMVTTLLLFCQSIYYGHIYPRQKSNKRQHDASRRLDRRECNNDANTEGFNNRDQWTSGSPRSLVVTEEPTSALRTPSSDVERKMLSEPLIGCVCSTESASPPKTKTMLCVVSLMTFFLGICNRQLPESREGNIRGKVFQVRRELLAVKRGPTNETPATEGTGVGTLLGWGMPPIYLGGRIPQIILNIRRGTVEGLNPLMFILALIGNGAYVASILVSSLDWLKIKPNLPWLVEAGGCFLLDCFILLQFLYYQQHRLRSTAGKYLS